MRPSLTLTLEWSSFNKYHHAYQPPVAGSVVFVKHWDIRSPLHQVTPVHINEHGRFALGPKPPPLNLHIDGGPVASPDDCAKVAEIVTVQYWTPALAILCAETFAVAEQIQYENTKSYGEDSSISMRQAGLIQESRSREKTLERDHSKFWQALTNKKVDQ